MNILPKAIKNSLAKCLSEVSRRAQETSPDSRPPGTSGSFIYGAQRSLKFPGHASCMSKILKNLQQGGQNVAGVHQRSNDQEGKELLSLTCHGSYRTPSRLSRWYRYSTYPCSANFLNTGVAVNFSLKLSSPSPCCPISKSPVA